MYCMPFLDLLIQSHGLLAGLPGVFPRASPVFAPPFAWPVS